MASHNNLRTGSVPGACDLDMLLSPLGVSGAQLETPPYNMPATGSRCAQALGMHGAVRGHTQESRDSHACADHQSGGVASPRDAVCNTNMTQQKRMGTFPYEMHNTYYTCIYLILY